MPHMHTSPTTMGRRTSWAPRRVPERMMDRAKKGSQKATMRSMSAACSTTRGSELNRPARGGASRNRAEAVPMAATKPSFAARVP